MNRRRFLLATVGIGSLALPSGIESTISQHQPVNGKAPSENSIEGRVGVAIEETNSPVVEGESLSVQFSAQIMQGIVERTEITLRVDGEVVDMVEVAFEEGDHTTGILTWETEDGMGSFEGVEVTVSIHSSDTSAETTVLVKKVEARREGMVFSQVFDAVEDLGLDPAGSTSIHHTLQSIETNTLIRFPPGDYLVEGLTDVSGLVIGCEAKTSGVRLVAAPEFNDWILWGREMEGLYISNIDIDQTSSNSSPGFFIHSSQIHMQDMEFFGRPDVWDTGSVTMIECAITDPDGHGELRNITAKKGHWARYGPNAGGRTGIYTGRRHVGTLKIINCDLREFGNNATYCSKTQPEGRVQIEDSYFENNNGSAIRIGGEGSYAKNCTVVVDPAVYTGPRTYEESSFTMRGIVVEERFEGGMIQKPPGAKIQHCSIRIEDNPANGAAIHRYGNGRALYVEDTDIEYNNNDYPAAVMVDAGGFGRNPEADPPRYLEFTNSSLKGSGDIEVAIHIERADGSLIQGSTIHMEGASQNGVRIEESSDCSIIDSTIDVPGDPTIFSDSNVEVRNLNLDYSPKEIF